jgi:hypothetical protein
MPKKKSEPPDRNLGANCITEKNPYRTIKTSLKSIIKNPIIHQKINDLVLRINPIVIDTYQFIRLYCLHLFHQQRDIPDLDSTFISYCMMTLGERDARGRQPHQSELLIELNQFYEHEFQPIFNHIKFDLKLITYPLKYIQQTMETCLSVNLKEHFVKRLLRFINIFADKYYDEHVGVNKEKNDEYTKTKRDTIWKLKKAVLENKSEDVPICLRNWFVEQRPHLYPEKINKTIPYDCQVQPFRYIKHSLYMNQCYEEYNELIRIKMLTALPSEMKELNQSIIKLFQPLSLRNTCVPKYITLDTATLINLFAEKGTKGNLLEKVKENQEQVWMTHFKMNKKLFTSKDYVFNYTIQTDGVGVSLLFKHKSMVDKKYGTKSKVKEVDTSIPYIDDLSDAQIEIMKSKKIVTADPGKLYLLYMMDDEGNELKYSCKQRDTESLAKRNRRIKQTNKKRSILNHEVNKSCPDIIACETELSEYSSTTVDVQKFKEFIKVKHETNIKVKTFYENELNRKINWRTKVYRQKSEDKFLHSIETQFGNKEDIVVCIGDWSAKQGSCIKGASTMGVGLKRLVRKRYTTLLLDEYNTSKKCCHCWKDISNITIDGSKKFRLLGCKHCYNECNDKKEHIGSPEDEPKSMFQSHRYFTRDKNSCLNMLGIVKHMIYNKRKRPTEFIRGQ